MEPTQSQENKKQVEGQEASEEAENGGELLSVAEAADALGVTTENVYIAIKQGRLPVARSRPTLITRANVRAYAANLGQRNGWKTRQTKIAPLQQEEGQE